MRAAVAEGRNSFGTYRGPDERTRMVLVERVMSPMAQSPVGYLVAVLDADAYFMECARLLEYQPVKIGRAHV